MKRIVFVALMAALTIAISSCNASQKAVALFKEKCPESKVTKLANGSYQVTVKCTELYSTAEMQKYIQKGVITYDFAGASISGVVQSRDSVPDLYGILVTIAKGAKRR